MAVVRSVTVLGNGLRGVVDGVDAGARNVAGETASRCITSATAIVASFQFLTSEAAGQQIRRGMETAPA